jgi:hypothetical protein
VCLITARYDNGGSGAARRDDDGLLIEQLFDPSHDAAQRPRVTARPSQRQRGLELGSDGIRYGLQRFRCISLRSAALHCARRTIDYAKSARFRVWSVVER